MYLIYSYYIYFYKSGMTEIIKINGRGGCPPVYRYRYFGNKRTRSRAARLAIERVQRLNDSLLSPTATKAISTGQPF